MAPVDDLIERIDARGLRWSFYRAALGHWCIVLGQDESELRHQSASLHELLTWATDAQVLPVVPRRPGLSRYEVQRTENTTRRWHILADGHFAIACQTKKDAEARIEAVQKREAMALREWNDTWGPLVATGVEGVDYRRQP